MWPLFQMYQSDQKATNTSNMELSLKYQFNGQLDTLQCIRQKALGQT
jgi:hypothetical protein